MKALSKMCVCIKHFKANQIYQYFLGISVSYKVDCIGCLTTIWVVCMPLCSLKHQIIVGEFTMAGIHNPEADVNEMKTRCGWDSKERERRIF